MQQNHCRLPCLFCVFHSQCVICWTGSTNIYHRPLVDPLLHPASFSRLSFVPITLRVCLPRKTISSSQPQPPPFVVSCHYHRQFYAIWLTALTRERQTPSALSMTTMTTTEDRPTVFDMSRRRRQWDGDDECIVGSLDWSARYTLEIADNAHLSRNSSGELSAEIYFVNWQDHFPRFPVDERTIKCPRWVKSREP